MKADFSNRNNVLLFPPMPKLSPFTATNRLRELRQARGWKLREVAEALGTTPTHINRLERGERDLTLAWMIPLARIYEVQPADLLLPEHGGLSPDQRHLVDTAREVPARFLPSRKACSPIAAPAKWLNCRGGLNRARNPPDPSLIATAAALALAGAVLF